MVIQLGNYLKETQIMTTVVENHYKKVSSSLRATFNSKISKNIDLNAKDRDGWTLFVFTCKHGHNDVVK